MLRLPVGPVAVASGAATTETMTDAIVREVGTA
jgi:hypothetical protein